MKIRAGHGKTFKTGGVFKGSVFFLILFYPAQSQAQTGANDSFSRANFAFLVHDNPELGFNNVGGSTLIFDLGNNVSSKFSVGLRTLATGGQNEKNRFYRLGSGVLVIYHINPTLLVHVSPGMFHETATLGAKIDSAHKTEYGYTGTQVIAGWEKQIVAINNAMKINWGTFLVYHSGYRDDSPSKTADSPQQTSGPAESKGWGKGIEFSFEFAL